MENKEPLDMVDLLDEEIAQQILKATNQDQQSQMFAVLVERYQSKMQNYGRRLLFDHSDIEDVVQEIFLKAYVNFRSYDPTRKFSTWLYRIAHNEFINHGKKFSRQIVDYFDLEVVFPWFKSSQNVESDFDQQELLESLEQYIEKLDFKYREPLLLSVQEQLSYQEISDVLRIPVSTVGVRINRARTILKKQIMKLKTN
ncbi:MAG: RNA polymerase sigma factor [Candidatus Doudnabacteria bacterium]